MSPTSIVFYSYVILLWTPCAETGDKCSEDTIKLGFLGAYGDLKFSLGAFLLAVEEVEKDPTLLGGKRVSIMAKDIGTSENVDGLDKEHSSYAALAIQHMTQMRDKGVSAFIGPDGNCAAEALVSAAWNMPMISYGCLDSTVSDKTVFGTFVRTIPPSSKISKFVVSLLKTFQWNKFALVSGKNPAWCGMVRFALKDSAHPNGLQVVADYQFTDYIPNKIREMEDIVENTYARTRIYVFVGEHLALIDFLACMQKKDLLDSGDYLVISVDDEIYDPNFELPGSNRGLRNFEPPDSLFRGFRSVLKLTQSHHENPRYKEICDKIKEYSEREPFFVPVPNQNILDTISVPVIAARLYDAVKIFAKAATSVIQEGGNFCNGTAIVNKILNSTYQSVLGYDVYIDKNGDAEGNYSVIAVKNDEKDKKLKMQPVGFFQYSPNSTRDSIPLFHYYKNRRLHWVGNKKPEGEPKCGFHGENCPSIAKNWKIISAVGAFVTFSLVVTVLGVKYEQKLACLLWKIDSREITVINEKLENSRLRESDGLDSILEDIPRNSSLHLGNYKGILVVVKRIYKKNIDMTRNVLKELIQMREIRHENLAQLLGACVEPNGNIFIVTEFYARGSLRDVLMNSDIKLDQMFFSSLVADVLKGMIYLHQSVINYHGNLTSSSCLVDSRWVLRLSNFGLREFKANQDDPDHRVKEVQRKLYRAPELTMNKISFPYGSQKGDVYSFGILLYEILGRCGPWGFNWQEMWSEMAVLGNKMFRPDTKVLSVDKFVVDCMEKCWHQEPECRPDFTTVRDMLKGMHSGLKPNIFDNMLVMMEKYSYNLEGLVKERTNQLIESKKKTEKLLHEMIPPSVAEDLKMGKTSIAESYDCVTIYFSDIVEFTSLSAKSTPLQVINLLNDLYTTCDAILTQYDVYKVETIGDAYMVASGLPLRNGDRHAGEIASMALHILTEVGMFKIRHIPQERLQIRIGIHSGKVVAGVVGTKMPRYCLFGDTVNTASRMESTGKPLRIHISTHTRDLLVKLGGYYCVERGYTYVKGKGDMLTHWLVSENKSVREKRLSKDIFYQTNRYELDD